ncbi:MAG: nicotinate-nucleotide--dimethylbenzimidazole phosphoribosyltransferase [Blastocatellia bacterium]|nr:nicotinate-nucleotide--dimethylbenzimidazole phosphoribosyltransferase [Blastocatellia bacterium]
MLEIVEKIAPIDKNWLEKAETRQLSLTKPPQSLGRLEEIANKICAIQATLKPNVKEREIFVLAASHGVSAENVSPYPSAVTAQMVANFLNGGAAINALAKTAKAKLTVVDIGVDGEIPRVEKMLENCRFVSAKVANGTKNFAQTAAMSETEMLQALEIGINLAKEAKQNGVKLIGLGEMGIGNTTSASVVTSALTGISPQKTVGRGTGADDEMLAHKVSIVEKSLQLHQPKNALEILQTVGGFEIAGLCGICLGAAAEKIAVVTDGFIATSAAALAVQICENVKDYLFASHNSVEIGHRVLLEFIGQEPLFDLQMRLGEGTGAALAMNIIESAVTAFNEMATFEQAAVSNI